MSGIVWKGFECHDKKYLSEIRVWEKCWVLQWKVIVRNKSLEKVVRALWWKILVRNSLPSFFTLIFMVLRIYVSSQKLIFLLSSLCYSKKDSLAVSHPLFSVIVLLALYVCLLSQQPFSLEVLPLPLKSTYRVAQVPHDVAEDVPGDLWVPGLAGDDKGVQEGVGELCLVIQHLLKVRDVPPLVCRVPVKWREDQSGMSLV